MKSSTICDLALVTLLIAGCAQRKADLTRGVSPVCQLHQAQMTKVSVPIEYGLVRLNDWGKTLEAASSNSFPHAEEIVFGGCIVGTPTQAVVYVCSQCQIARQKWVSEHPAPK